MKKRRPGESIGEEYVPSGATEPYRFSRFSRGTRTWSKRIRPLSMPLSPPLRPSSSMVMPFSHRVPPTPSSSRMGTKKACTPWFTPFVMSWANTTAARPCSAELPMYSFHAARTGVSISNSSDSGS